MKYQIKSIFEQIAEQVFKMSDLNKAKMFIQEFVTEKEINDNDKHIILKNISDIKSMVKLQTYLCNSLLKYEGMSLSKPGKVDKPEGYSHGTIEE